MRMFLLISIAVMVLLVALFLAFGSSLRLAGPGASGREVRVEPVDRRELIERVSAPGEIEPNVKVDVSAEVSARILELRFEKATS